jgi:hypothetical protein
LALGLALLVLAASVVPTSAGSVVVYQPDLRVRKPGGELRGNNIYNLTTAGQSVGGVNAIGTTRQYVLSVQNDGNVPDQFRIKVASWTGNGTFTIQYFVGWPGQNVTGEMFFNDPGPLTTPTLAPGQVYYFRVYVWPLATSGDGYVSQTVLAESVTGSGNEDTVGMNVFFVP